MAWSFFLICQVGFTQQPLRRQATADPASVGSPLSHLKTQDSLGVGDISFDASTDDSTFRVGAAHQVFQYYNTGSFYLDHKKEIAGYVIRHYRPGKDTAGQTGYLTIRFIINYAGETGWFRLYELDSDYHPFRFNKDISGQLLTLLQKWKGWRPAVYQGKACDSYQYITFTLQKGRIVCITP